MFGGKLSGCSKFWCIHKIRSRNVLITLRAYIYQKTHKPLFEQKQIEDHDYQNKRKHLIPRETKEVWCAKAITVTSHDRHGVPITGNTTVSERLVQPYQKESSQALLGHHAVSPRRSSNKECVSIIWCNHVPRNISSYAPRQKPVRPPQVITNELALV